MDSEMPNSQRNQSGSGSGSGVDDKNVQSVNAKDLMRDQEEPTDAPDILPFQLDTIERQLGDMFTAVIETKKTFNQIKEHPDFNESNQQKLDEVNKELDSIGSSVTSLANFLDVFKLKQ
mgnify:CR=1 FL=1|tara:strand:+ start:714 stop:1070 length:357 start_codon:yes stop_codon:yes gene_type:complete